MVAKALEPYEGQFDFVLVDTGPDWDPLTVNVLFYTEEILCPISMEVLAMRGFRDFLSNVNPIKEYRKELSISYILPTFFDGRVKKSSEILSQLQKHFGDIVCDPIRYSVRLSEAPGYGKNIFEYAPQDRATEDYKKLIRRVLNNGKK